MNSGKVLVTGASGFLGSRIAEGLSALGLQVVATGRNWRTALPLPPQVERVSGDITNPGNVAELLQGCDTIVHAAALSAPWGPEQEFFRVNVLATRYLLQAAAKQGVKRFLFISTPSIYFNYQNRIGVRESDPLPERMVNAYASTKLLAEQDVLASGLDAIALRPRAIIGRGDRVIMPRLLKALEAGRLRRIGDASTICDLTAVQNVLEAVRCALSAGNAALGKAYNITNDEPVKLWEAIDQMLKMLHLQPVNRSLPYPIAYGAASVMEAISSIMKKEPVLTRYGVGILARSMTLNIDAARTHLGYKPVQSTGEALQEFAHWWLELTEEEKKNL